MAVGRVAGLQIPVSACPFEKPSRRSHRARLSWPGGLGVDAGGDAGVVRAIKYLMGTFLLVAQAYRSTSTRA